MRLNNNIGSRALALAADLLTFFPDNRLALHQQNTSGSRGKLNYLYLSPRLAALRPVSYAMTAVKNVQQLDQILQGPQVHTKTS